MGGMALLCLLSCNKETGQAPDNQGTMVLSVSLPQTSKTHLGERNAAVWPTLWSEGDCISLGGNISYPLSNEEAGKSTASFVFAGSVKAPYNILYPATIEPLTVTFPAEQRYVNGTFDPAAAPMYSASRSFDNTTMLHLGSLLKLSLKSATGAKISQVQVSSMGGEKLSGDFVLATDEDGLCTGEFLSAEGSTSTSMTFADGLALGTDPVDLFIGIPHALYTRGFSLLVIADDARVMNLTFASKTGVELPAGRIIEFEAVEFEGMDKILLIKDAADLASLATAPDGTTAFLVTDIDMSEVQWVPISNLSVTLNGAGHLLKGIHAPLCNILSGTIKDLNIQANITMSSSQISAFALDLQGSDALIENCHSSGTITLTGGTISERVSAAGIAATQSDGTIRLCTNSAAITIDSGLVSNDQVDLGGIVGNELATIENCTNNGALTVKEGAVIGSYLNAGGVCGCLEASAAHLRGNGPVKVEGGVVMGATNGRQHVGGVVGYHIGSDTVLSDLVGNAFVYSASACTASGSANAIGGVVGKNNAGLIDGSITSTPDARVEVVLPDGTMNAGIAGLVGYSYNTVKGLAVKDAVNNAAVDVTFAPGANLDVISVGGITGYQYSNANGYPMSMEGCVNKGTITTHGAASPAATDIVSGVRVGGLFGHIQITGASPDNILTIKDCRNEGKVSMLESAGGKFCYEGGITATAWAADLRILSCTNTGEIVREGYTSLFYMGGIMAHQYRTGPSKMLIEGCYNSGKIGFYDGAAANTAEVAAGGIIGMMSAKGTANTLEAVIRDCHNTGNIDRFTEVATYAGRNSFGGGILGGMGKSHAISGYDVFESVLIEECTNSGQIIFNQFKGFDTFIEKTTNNSFCGGIAGCTRSSKGGVVVKNCDNSGNVLSTSGFQGGLVGFLVNNSTVCGEKTASGVRFCTNSGSIGKVSDTDSPATLGSGYNICGGIVGYLKDHASLKNHITYCWNSGDVYGTTQDSSPCAGGIVGKLLEGGVVSYCKNSGNIRNYKSAGKGGLLYSGSISGNTPLSGTTDYQVSYCGVGGKVYRTSGWTVLEEGGTYPWQNYIYSNTAMLDAEGNPSPQYPQSKYYDGCTFWDGVSKLSWEE